MPARLPNPEFSRFCGEVDEQLELLGSESAWPSEVRPFFEDGLSAPAAAMAIVDGREDDHMLSPWLQSRREHGLTARELGVGR